jgi:hypothetical protein
LPLVALLLVPAAAGADEATERANALVQEASDLGRAGKLEEAIAKFKAAEQLLPRAIHDCNIGLAYVRLQRWPQAEMFLARCRERWSAEETRPLEPWVDRRIREAQKQLSEGDYGPVRLTSEPAGATIFVAAFGDDESFDVPRIIWLPAGEHRLEASADGYEPTAITVTAVRGERVDIAIALAAVAVELSPPSDEAAQAITALPGNAEVATDVAPRRSRKVGWIVSGGGLGLVAAGGVFHALAFDAKSDAEKLGPGPEFDALDDKFSKRRAVAIGAYAVGGATIAAGIYLLVRSRGEREPAPPVSVGSGPGDVGVSVLWRTW